MGELLDEGGQQARYELVDCGLWIVDCGLWIVDCGLWIVDCGQGG